MTKIEPKALTLFYVVIVICIGKIFVRNEKPLFEVFRNKKMNASNKGSYPEKQHSQ